MQTKNIDFVYDGRLIETFEVKEVNTSKKHYTGRRIQSASREQRCWFTILGQSTRLSGKKNTPNRYYLIEFDDYGHGKYMKEAPATSIENLKPKNRLCPSVEGAGYVGVGEYSCKHHNKEYRLWKGIVQRCYDGRKKDYENVRVGPMWLNFQNFAKSLPKLAGYDLWMYSDEDIELDKDILIKGNRIYMEEACMFVTNKANTQQAKKTGKLYEAVRTRDGYSELFTIQAVFARKYGLQVANVNKAIQIPTRTAKGWSFSIVDSKKVKET